MVASAMNEFLFNYNLGNSKIIEIIYAMESSEADYQEFMRLLEELMLQVCGTIDPFTLGGEKRMQKGSLANSDFARRGFHVYRSWAARTAHKKRVKAFSNDKKMAMKFLKDGLIILEDFFDGVDYDAIEKEFREFPCVVHKRPDNICQMNGHKAPILNELYQKIINHPSLEHVLGARKGSPMRGFFEQALRANTFYQRVHNKPDDNDNQKNLHIDTFFPALKFWWFSQDVSADQGAFVYALGSANHTTEYYSWLYEESIKVCDKNYEDWKLRDHEEGSLRVSETELKVMGLEAKPVEVKKNTLVLGNVGGFHGRGHTTEEFIRNTIHGSVRTTAPYVF